MSINGTQFNSSKLSHEQYIDQVISGITPGTHIAFVKGIKKHILKVQRVTPTMHDDIEITACGIVYQRGIFSIDGVAINGNKSAAGFNVDGGYANSIFDIPETNSLWEDEMNNINYMAVYSTHYPLTLKNLLHTKTTNHEDDIRELREISSSQFNTVINILTNKKQQLAQNINYIIDGNFPY